jgi:signal peptide peptidase SppA
MNLPNIISKVIGQPWLITAEKHHAIMSALEAKLSGDFQTINSFDERDPDSGSGRDEYREFQTAGGTIAVIPVHGILGKHLSSMETACGGCSLDTLQNQLRTAFSPRISRVLLDINSPGGTVTGTPETAALIRELAAVKPVWAFTDADACSGALWLASQCNEFYASESAEVGSCGVRMVLLDITEQLKDEGVKVNAIYSGKYKMLGASFKSLEPEEREMLQAESNRIHAQFQSAVQSVRNVDEHYLQGQVFRGEEAAGIGMTSGVLADLDEVLFRLEHMPLR